MKPNPLRISSMADFEAPIPRSRPLWEQEIGLEGRLSPPIMDPWVKIIGEFGAGLLIGAGALMLGASLLA